MSQPLEDQFRLAPPRILIESSAQIEVYEALHWGRADRRGGGGGGDDDPVQDLWTPDKGIVQSAATSAFGFTLDQLQSTSDALRNVIDSTLYDELPTRECKDADAVVRYAIRKFVGT